jgi:hypothetical protein
VRKKGELFDKSEAKKEKNNGNLNWNEKMWEKLTNFIAEKAAHTHNRT